MLTWSASKRSIDLLPMLTNPKDTSCIGFDFTKHKLNLTKLKATGFFAEAFIKNYDQIIITLDKKTKNNEFGKWYTNELPPFIFANDVDPWSLCQDVPYDKPSPWDYVEVNALNTDKGAWEWKWGKLPSDADPSWHRFSYKFKVVKEDNKWKIAYLEGFDFKKGIQKDGL